MFFFKYFLGGFFIFFVLCSTLLNLPPFRFHCADGCWDPTQDRCNWCTRLYFISKNVTSSLECNFWQNLDFYSISNQYAYVERINIMLNVESKNSFLPRGLKPKWSTGMGASVCACDLKYEDEHNLNNYPTYILKKKKIGWEVIITWRRRRIAPACPCWRTPGIKENINKEYNPKHHCLLKVTGNYFSAITTMLPLTMFLNIQFI